MDLKSIQNKLRHFAAEREWDKYHSPKNLSMALAVEASELMELFQWVGSEESRNVGNDAKLLEATKEELADVALYAARLADVLDIDLESAMLSKIEQNARKYPASKRHEWSME